MGSHFKNSSREMEAKMTKVTKKKNQWLAYRFNAIFERERIVESNSEVLDTFSVSDDRTTQV